MNICWGSADIAPDEWSASRHSIFTPGERTLGTHWTEGLVSPRAGLNAVAKRKKFHHCPYQEFNPKK